MPSGSRDASSAPSAALNQVDEKHETHQTDLEPKAARTVAKPALRSTAATAAALQPVLLFAAGAAATAAALFFLVRKVRHLKTSRVKRASVGKHQVFSTVLALREPSVPLPPPAAPTLSDRTLVLSNRLDVQGLETGYGCQPWKRQQKPARQTYGPADVLIAAGAQGTAVVVGEPLGLGPLLSITGSGTPNPAGKGRAHGGGEYGAAACVAAGLADLALAVDELGTAFVPAACCGAYALRTTAGVLPLEGAATTSASLAAPALLAADPQMLLKAGQALRLPGAGTASTQVLNYLVAEDLFAAAGEEAHRMMPAVVSAVKRWAGPDQAQALSLCEWLHHRVASLAAFKPKAQQASAGTRQQRSEHVLQALAAAAQVLRRWEFVQQYGTWVEAHQHQLEAAVVEYWQRARQVGEEQYRSARAVAEELQSAMRSALLDGYIFVLPTTPGPAPPTVTAAGPAAVQAAKGASEPSSSEAQEMGVFRERCAQFAAVASLSGVPQVALPLSLPGGMPLSVSLLALHKRDLLLLQAAAKLGPMLGEEAAALAAKPNDGVQSGWQPQAAAAEAAAGGIIASDKGAKSSRSNGKRSQNGGTKQAAQEAAEARKEEGNAAFRVGRYEEAVRQYSAAIQLYPLAAVYHANRAMAYLKLGSYGAAEADCDAALKLELNAKALLRRGSARLAQGNVSGAQADFRQVLALEPQNRQARDELRGILTMEEAGQREAQLGLF